MALLFIGWDVHLVSEAGRIQHRIDREVQALSDLDRVEDGFRQLELVQRVDARSSGAHWPGERERLAERIQLLAERSGDLPGMGELAASLQAILHESDSLYDRVQEDARNGGDHSASQGVLRIVIQRARKEVDQASRSVHQEGLVHHTALLSKTWDEAQVLLFLACLMAVIFALLVGMNRRLLLESRDHGRQLWSAKRELEKANRELRETMLSKEEKEVMIKEIHHRVKNNLQIVKSLIRFQSDKVSDPPTVELFNECVNRVSAMALVHEQTYLSKDLSNIDVSGYLDQLVRNLTHAYTIDTRLELDVDIQLPTLGVDTLIPLGLLINEVISNSFKHAFKGRSHGRITVHLNGSEKDGLELHIGDNGTGLPDQVKWEQPASLGMELIHTLAEQLDAHIELVDEGPGTMYRLCSKHMRLQRRA